MHEIEHVYSPFPKPELPIPGRGSAKRRTEITGITSTELQCLIRPRWQWARGSPSDYLIKEKLHVANQAIAVQQEGNGPYSALTLRITPTLSCLCK
jgi:hypothetical protein